MEKGRGRRENFQGGAAAQRVSQGAVIGRLDLGVVPRAAENLEERGHEGILTAWCGGPVRFERCRSMVFIRVPRWTHSLEF